MGLMGRAVDWLRREDQSLFLALLLLHLVPVWAFSFFPSQDGPVHVETANILRQYHAPERVLFRTFYTLNTEPEPNLLSHWLMAGLLFLFPPLVTEKLLVSLYVILFPVSVRYALKAIDSRARFLSVLAFPFVLSWLLHMGFFNFCLSVALYFFVAGYWMRRRDGFSARSVLALATLMTMLYFAHVIGLAMALVMLAVLCLWLPLAGPGSARSFLTRAGCTALAALPVVLLTARFLALSHDMIRQPAMPRERLWQWLRGMESLVSFRPGEFVLAAAVFWGFAFGVAGALVARVRKRSLQIWDGLLVTAIVYGGLYFALPPGLLGGAYLGERLAVFPFFALILWFGSQAPSSRPVRWTIQGATAVVAVSWLALHMGTYARLAQGFAEYRSIEDHVEPDKTLLPLRYGGYWAAPRVDVFLKTAGYVAASRNLVELVNHEGHKRHFPIVFREGLNPYEELGNAETRPPCVDIPSYSAKSGVSVDYVLVWHLRPVELRQPCVQSVREQLASGYDLIYTSEPRGLARLYRRRPGGAR
jgi:hypothetical protein